jgi:DNA polymerase-4
LDEKIFVHVDMDAFFISVEELADPSLKGLPCAVAGPGKRSIITTSSYPARKMGVRTGMPVYQAQRLCPELKIIRAGYRKYSDASGKVMEVLESFTPQLQITSVDEAWFEGTALLSEYLTSQALGMAVKSRVKEVTGLTCSVGIGENRLIAKLASDMEKPDGLTIISPDEVKGIMEKMPVEKIGGIGPKTTEVLHSMGIRTCGQLGRYPSELINKRFGVRGSYLSSMAHGEDPRDQSSKERAEPARSVGHSVTLPEDTNDMDYASQVLLTLAEMVGRRVRKHGFSGRCVTVTWRYNDMSTHTKQNTLPVPVTSTQEIYRTAHKILKTVDLKKGVRLLGVSISKESKEYTNGLLFQDDHPISADQGSLEQGCLQEALDEINNRYGEFTLTRADTIPEFGEKKVISPSWRAKGIRKSD